MDSTSFSLQAVWVRRNPWIIALALLPFAAVFSGIVAAITVHGALLGVALQSAIIGTVILGIVLRRDPWPRETATTVIVEQRVLRIGSATFDRRSLAGGTLFPTRDGWTVALLRKLGRPRLRLRVTSEERANALLHALAFGHDQAVARFRAASWVASAAWRLPATAVAAMLVGGLGCAALMPLSGEAAVAMLPLAFFACVALALTPTRVDVGADGTLLSWLGHRRFVPHRAIEDLGLENVGFPQNPRWVLTLRLDSGERLALQLGSDMNDALALGERIRAACGGGEGDSSTAAESLLRRGERSHDDWVRRLLTYAARTSHRQAPVLRELLWRVVEDPHAEALERAAAAVALRVDLDGAERARLSEIAEATAGPKLRRLLAPDAGGAEPETLALALAELEQERKQAQAGR